MKVCSLVLSADKVQEAVPRERKAHAERWSWLILGLSFHAPSPDFQVHLCYLICSRYFYSSHYRGVQPQSIQRVLV